MDYIRISSPTPASTFPLSYPLAYTLASTSKDKDGDKPLMEIDNAHSPAIPGSNEMTSRFSTCCCSICNDYCIPFLIQAEILSSNPHLSEMQCTTSEARCTPKEARCTSGEEKSLLVCDECSKQLLEEIVCPGDGSCIIVIADNTRVRHPRTRHTCDINVCSIPNKTDSCSALHTPSTTTISVGGYVGLVKKSYFPDEEETTSISCNICDKKEFYSYFPMKSTEEYAHVPICKECFDRFSSSSLCSEDESCFLMSENGLVFRNPNCIHPHLTFLPHYSSSFPVSNSNTKANRESQL